MNRREETIEFRVTKSEKHQIERQAESANTTVSDYLRSIGTRDDSVKSVPKINREAWGDLSRALSNLNQLVHHINGDRVTEIEPDLVKELYTMVQRLRQDLRGESK